MRRVTRITASNLLTGIGNLLHPATRDGFAGCALDRYTDELAALLAARVIALTRRPDVALGGYSDF
jgi:hypothetical protein